MFTVTTQILKDRIYDPRWLYFYVLATFLSIPISTSAKSIFLPLTVFAIFFLPDYRANISRVLEFSWCRISILFFLLVLCACVWGPAALNEKILVLEKYTKLLYLPILTLAFKEEKLRWRCIQVFLIAMFITCLISIGKHFNLIHFEGLDPGRVFHNHIMTGYMMSFAAYLCGILASKSQKQVRIFYITGLLIFSYQVCFVNTGRTGYVIYLLLMMVLSLQILTWKQIMLAAFLGAIGAGGIYYENTGVHTRVHQVVEDLHEFKHQNKDTSVGYRLQFHEYARRLLKQHPLVGNGTGGFTHLYAQDKPVASWQRRLLEPHSLYWLTAAELGMLGLTMLALFFGSLFIASLQLKVMKPIAIAILIPFMIGNLTDSLLFYSGTGYFFILFMALCLSEGVYSKR